MSPLLPSFVTLLFVAGAYACRKFAPKAHFFHTDGGAALLAGLVALCDAGGQYISASGLHGEGLAQALMGALLSLLATSNPSMAAASSAPPRPPINLVPLFLALTSVGLLGACGHATPAADAFGKAFGACMESKGLAAAPGLASDVFQILSAGGGSAQALEIQLEGLGIKAGEDAMACAVAAWLGSNPVQADGGVAPAQAAARVYLARHAKGLRK